MRNLRGLGMVRVVAAGLALAAVALPVRQADAESSLRVAMTAGDIAVTTGTADQGFEGFRFVAWSLYDALVGWDLSSSDKPSDIVPGLATEWAVDPADPKRWVFKLRQGVKWHDGCPFTAEDVVWNYRRVTDNTAPQFFAQQFALTRAYMTNVANMEKVDDNTVAITTKFVESLFPYTMSYVPLISRCRAEALKYDWAAYAMQPSGTGPYLFDKMIPRERLELVPNKAYWNPKRVPKHDRMVLIPMPEAATRVAALLSGQVNFVEAPPPDTIPRLKSAGMQIVTNAYPHNWPFTLNFHKGPFTDIRVRKAANYALNRADFVELLGGMATEQYAQVPPSTPYYGKPIRYEFNTAKATALLKEANCYPCNVNLAISTSGSGQMQPLPMNELLKAQLEAAGFKINFMVMDWNAMLEIFRGGVEKFPEVHGVNGSRAVMDPVVAIIKPVAKAYWSPAGSNWGHFYSDETEALVGRIFNEFDAAKRLALLTKLHEVENEQAVMIYVVHDINPRALSPKIKGFVQSQNWFQDMTPIVVLP
jgi:peptide/nickel transport system substrate-binding protein